MAVTAVFDIPAAADREQAGKERHIVGIVALNGQQAVAVAQLYRFAVFCAADIDNRAFHPPFHAGGFGNLTQCFIAVSTSGVVNIKVFRFHAFARFPGLRIHPPVQVHNHHCQLFARRGMVGFERHAFGIEHKRLFYYPFHAGKLNVIAPFYRTDLFGRVSFEQPKPGAEKISEVAGLQPDARLGNHRQGQCAFTLNGCLMCRIAGGVEFSPQDAAFAVYVEFCHLNTF